MKKQRAIDAIALYEQISAEVGSMLKQPPGIIVSKLMAMVLQAPTIFQQPDPWTNVEDGMPTVPGDVNGHGEITVAVMFKTEQRVHTMIYERAIVRGKTVYRWKWPWDRIYSDGGISAGHTCRSRPKNRRTPPMEQLNRNAEHYADPTPAAALKNIYAKEEADRLRKISTMMATLKQAADLAGLEVVGRVVFRDKSTGKEYR